MTESLPQSDKAEHEQTRDASVAQTDPERLTALEQALSKAQERQRHAEEQWKRCEADLQNYRKRVERERGEWIQSSLAVLVKSLLPVLDDLDRAFQTLPYSLRGLTWTEGLQLVQRKFVLTLEQQGLKEIDALGKVFDPTRHQALLEGQSKEVPDGSIMAVLQRGYLFDDKVLRPALVQVARRPPTDADAPGNEGKGAGDGNNDPDCANRE